MNAINKSGNVEGQRLISCLTVATTTTRPAYPCPDCGNLLTLEYLKKTWGNRQTAINKGADPNNLHKGSREARQLLVYTLPCCGETMSDAELKSLWGRYMESLRKNPTYGVPGGSAGPGRPKSRKQRCPCGDHTLKRAIARGYDCCRANGVNLGLPPHAGTFGALVTRAMAAPESRQPASPSDTQQVLSSAQTQLGQVADRKEKRHFVGPVAILGDGRSVAPQENVMSERPKTVMSSRTMSDSLPVVMAYDLSGVPYSQLRSEVARRDQARRVVRGHGPGRPACQCLVCPACVRRVRRAQKKIEKDIVVE